MKKILTVSLFAMMAVSAANADIASTKYVDDIAKTKQASLGFTPENVANKVTDIPVDTNDLTDAQYPSAKAMVSYVGEELQTMQGGIADTIDPLTSRVTTAEGNITSLQSDKANKSDVYTKTEADTEFMDSSEVSTAISNVVKDYSTTAQMNNAIKTANDTQTNTITSAYQLADTTTLSSAKSYADTEDKKIEDTIGTVTQGKTVVKMIEDVGTTASTNLTNTLKNYSTTEQMNTAITNNAVNTVESGSDNGTIAVDGQDVAVKGLGSAAYTASSDYDASGSAATAKSEAVAAAKTETTTQVNALKNGAVKTNTDNITTITTNLGGLNGVTIPAACQTGRCALVMEAGKAKWETING